LQKSNSYGEPKNLRGGHGSKLKEDHGPPGPSLPLPTMNYIGCYI